MLASHLMGPNDERHIANTYRTGPKGTGSLIFCGIILNEAFDKNLFEKKIMACCFSLKL